MRKKWVVAGIGSVVLVATGLGWFFREPAGIWYGVRQVKSAPDGSWETWADRLCAYGPKAHVRLLNCWTAADPTICQRVGMVLGRISDDSQAAAIAARIAEQFASFSSAGQIAAMTWAVQLTDGDRPHTMAACRPLIRPGLKNSAAEVRVRSVCLAMRTGDSELTPVVPHLRDTAAEVRRAAVLAVGPSRQLIADEDLLRWLHDTDAEVRDLCMTALSSRGLSRREVRRGRLLTDARPAARVELISELVNDTEIDLGNWLGRLSQDPSPAVRAAVARAAAERRLSRLGDRLAQMAKADPDPAVRLTAQISLDQVRTPPPN